MDREIIQLIRKILQPELNKRSDYSVITRKELIKIVKRVMLNELPDDFYVNSVTKTNMEEFLSVLLTEINKKIEILGTKYTVKKILDKMKMENSENV